MLTAYKYQLKPNSQQRILINKHMGCSRFIYNYLLSTHKANYKEDNTIKWNRYVYQNFIPLLKKDGEHDFLKEVNSQSLQCAVLNLDRAYKNFFEGRAKEPTYHSKKDYQSFHIPQNVRVVGNELHIPKFKNGIRINLHRKLVGIIRNATISKSKSNKYYVSIVVDDGIKSNDPNIININDGIGIDLGIKDFAILSNGIKVDNPKFLSKSLKKLQRLHRRHSKTTKKSKNREKARIRLARQHERVANQRKDFQHKLSKQLVDDNQVNFICMEDLNVKGLIRNRKLSRAIGDVGWGQFKTFLKYKCERANKLLVEIGRFVPTSKKCSHCGYKHSNLTLADRYWDCPCCGRLLDRDINAAKNILLEGISFININYRTLGTSGSYACRDSVRPLDEGCCR